MTQTEQNLIAGILDAAPVLGLGYLARELNALYHAARSAKSRDDIHKVAYAHGAHKSPQFTTSMASGTYISYNPEQEHRSHRWEVWCDAGVFGFPTRAHAIAYQTALTKGAAA
jgi:hypothetical protein